jgi:hypothetical protein
MVRPSRPMRGAASQPRSGGCVPAAAPNPRHAGCASSSAWVSRTERRSPHATRSIPEPSGPSSQSRHAAYLSESETCVMACAQVSSTVRLVTDMWLPTMSRARSVTTRRTSGRASVEQMATDAAASAWRRGWAGSASGGTPWRGAGSGVMGVRDALPRGRLPTSLAGPPTPFKLRFGSVRGAGG